LLARSGLLFWLARKGSDMIALLLLAAVVWAFAIREIAIVSRRTRMNRLIARFPLQIGGPRG